MMNAKIKKKSLRRFVSLVLIFALMVSFSTTVKEVSAAGNDTLPYGEYEIGSFTFSNHNLTPTKTVGATGMLKFGVSWRVANSDKGVGEIKLTVQVRDVDTQKVLSSIVVKRESYDDMYYVYDETPAIYVTKGTKLQIWFDASSVGTSNGNYRSAYIQSFCSIIY